MACDCTCGILSSMWIRQKLGTWTDEDDEHVKKHHTEFGND